MRGTVGNLMKGTIRCLFARHPDELLSVYETLEDLLGEDGLFKQLKKALLGRALGGKLTQHLDMKTVFRLVEEKAITAMELPKTVLTEQGRSRSRCAVTATGASNRRSWLKTKRAWMASTTRSSPSTLGP